MDWRLRHYVALKAARFEVMRSGAGAGGLVYVSLQVKRPSTGLEMPSEPVG